MAEQRDTSDAELAVAVVDMVERAADDSGEVSREDAETDAALMQVLRVCGPDAVRAAMEASEKKPVQKYVSEGKKLDVVSADSDFILDPGDSFRIYRVRFRSF